MSGGCDGRADRAQKPLTPQSISEVRSGGFVGYRERLDVLRSFHFSVNTISVNTIEVAAKVGHLFEKKT